MNLNIGCGPQRVAQDGWLAVDKVDLPPFVDVVADVANLPFPDGAFDLTYAGHLLEHLEWEMVPRSLLEIFSVTRRECLIITPDIAGWARAYIAGRIAREELADVVTGGRRYKGDEHLWLPTPQALELLIKSLGWEPEFMSVEKVAAQGWPIHNASDPFSLQTAVIARPGGAWLG